ncbi:pantetheine-phosphate adenylyltransferase [Spiroplasma alleghenense]|uniref:Phosphopantetheine adenylyltransferase n=1 Tax=Spiroplasma alleghenense TaxID=216931 RepID=A0A345Z477_9MOLU|nr:pantetheine-phosphate adenylyltransferase [Spiroplasma alleghenense]AXK51406.1 phosphopantetheine adenylyltransferase [Spiroplasma alleghenense]
MIGIYSGSFDPIHEGHIEIINKALKVFNEVWVVVSKNINKDCQTSLDDRVKMIEKQLINFKNIKVMKNEDKLTADFARENNINFLIRGLRNSDDLKYEIMLADGNKSVYPEIETVFFISDLPVRQLSSSIIREINAYKTKK